MSSATKRETNRILKQLHYNPRFEEEYPTLIVNQTNIPNIVSTLNFNPNGVPIEDIHLQTQNFSLSDLRGYVLNSEYTNTLDTDREHISFESRIVFSNSRFDYANLSDARFGRSFMDHCSFHYTNLYHVFFEDVDLTEANFTNVILNRTEFAYLNLFGANFTKVKLNRSIFRNVDLTNVNFTNANIENIDFSEVISFQNTNFENVIFNRNTIFRMNRIDNPNLPNVLEQAINMSDELYQHIREQYPANEEEDAHNAEQEGIAYHVHNMFDKININGYKTILETSLRSNQKPVNVVMPMKDIKSAFINIIDTYFKNDFILKDKIETSTNKLSAVIKKAEKCYNKKSDLDLKTMVSNTVQFLSIQTEQFQTLYLDLFITDCYHGYSDANNQPYIGPEGMSCDKGVIQRIVLMIGRTVEAICMDRDNCTELYKQLIPVFGIVLEKDGVVLDINELSKQWGEILESEKPQEPIQNANPSLNHVQQFQRDLQQYRQLLEQYNKNQEEYQKIAAMNPEEVENHYRNFIKDKYIAANVDKSQYANIIENEANKLRRYGIFERKSFYGGMGGKRRTFHKRKVYKRKMTIKKLQSRKPRSNLT